MSSKNSSDKNDGKKIRAYMLYAGLGLSLCTEIVVSGLIGWWLGRLADQKWGTTPWCMTGGIVLFLVISLIHIVMTLQKIQERSDDE